MTGERGLAVGERAPAVQAPLVRPDGPTETVPLSDLYADRPVLLAFYTNDFSPDCVTEWCSFRDYDWFASGDRVQVVGVSRSRPTTHRQFIDRLGLGFPLYADRNLDITGAFDVTYRTFKLFKRPHRSLFLLDTDGTIKYRWLADHPIDPTRETPPLNEVHTAVSDALGLDDPETFGFD